MNYRAAQSSPVVALAPSRPVAARAFDALAMASFPLVARALGFWFRVGTGDALARDGHAVHSAVWTAKAVPDPAAHLAWIGDRYERATATWIVAYHRGRPVGVMSLLDLRVASVTLDLERAAPPRHLDLARTLEIARLAIADGYRGGAQIVMVGLLREMLAFAKRSGIEHLFAGSTAALFRVFRSFNAASTAPRRWTSPSSCSLSSAPSACCATSRSTRRRAIAWSSGSRSERHEAQRASCGRHRSGRAVLRGQRQGGILAQGVRGVRPTLALALSVFGGAAASNVALAFGRSGPSLGNGNSCASGSVAIGEAAHSSRAARSTP